ncbi:MAG: hypothetical protein AAGJ35_11925, partial [Myxococcota bacterium]
MKTKSIATGYKMKYQVQDGALLMGSDAAHFVESQLEKVPAPSDSFELPAVDAVAIRPSLEGNCLMTQLQLVTVESPPQMFPTTGHIVKYPSTVQTKATNYMLPKVELRLRGGGDDANVPAAANPAPSTTAPAPAPVAAPVVAAAAAVPAAPMATTAA